LFSLEELLPIDVEKVPLKFFFEAFFKIILITPVAAPEPYNVDAAPF